MAETKQAPPEIILSRVSDIPNALLLRIRNGFVELSKVDKAAAQAAVLQLAKKISSGDQPGREEIARVLATNEKSSENILLAVSVTLAMILDVDIRKDDYLDLMSDKTFDEEGRAGAELTTQTVIDNKDYLSTNAEETSISGALLPAYRACEVEIDIRVRFEGDKIKKAVPIAIVYLDTDDSDQRVYFQIKAADLDELIGTLTKARDNILVAKSASELIK